MTFFDMEDYGYAEKIVDRIIGMKCDNGLPILPSTKNVKNQSCYVKACKMLWAIYDGAFFKKYSFAEREDYDMTDWRKKIKDAQDDWGKVRTLALNSVKHFYKALYPEYCPINKNYLKTIRFSNFFETGMNQSMFVNCINEPLPNAKFFTKEKIKKIKEDIPEKFIKSATDFCEKYDIVGHKFESIYWEGVCGIIKWWKLFCKYTDFGFDVKGNFSKNNILEEFMVMVEDYVKINKKTVNPYWFKIYDDDCDSSVCDGFFKSFISTDRFAVAKNLPHPLSWYGNEERFKTLVKKQKSKIIIDNADDGGIVSLED